MTQLFGEIHQDLQQPALHRLFRTAARLKKSNSELNALSSSIYSNWLTTIYPPNEWLRVAPYSAKLKT